MNKLLNEYDYNVIKYREQGNLILQTYIECALGALSKAVHSHMN